MCPALALRVANIHLNMAHFMTIHYLRQILTKHNPLTSMERLNLSAPEDLELGSDALNLLLERLPALTNINTSRWGKLEQEEIDAHKLSIKLNNWNLSIEQF